MDFTRSAVPVELNGEMSSQSQSLNSMDFGSDFSARWRKDKLLWSVSSDMAYSASPSYSLNISSGDGGILQSVSGEVFSSENTVSAVWKKRHNRIYIPLIFNTQTDWLKTDRTGDGLTNEDNDLARDQGGAILLPSVRVQSAGFCAARGSAGPWRRDLARR